MSKKSIAETAKAVASRDETLKLEQELRRSQRSVTELTRDKAALMKRLDALEEDIAFIKAVPPPAAVLRRLATGHKRTGSRDATAVFLASDWHVEETVTLDETNGMNFYDLAEAERRIEAYFAGVVTLLEGWTTGKNAAVVRDIVIALIGDLINGYLREEDLICNGLTPTVAVRWLEERIASGLQHVLDKTDVRIHVVCRTGNHGRVKGINNNRIMWSQKEAMSLEHLLYHFLSVRFAEREEKRLTFDVPDEGLYTYLDVKGVTIRFMHGDTVKYQGGIGGLTIPLRKAILRLNQGRAAHVTCLGHFHQTVWEPNEFIVNGSMVGMNSYGMALGFRPEQPQQCAFLVRQNRGVATKEEIWLTEAR